MSAGIKPGEMSSAEVKSQEIVPAEVRSGRCRAEVWVWRNVQWSNVVLTALIKLDVKELISAEAKSAAIKPKRSESEVFQVWREEVCNGNFWGNEILKRSDVYGVNM